MRGIKKVKKGDGRGALGASKMEMDFKRNQTCVKCAGAHSAINCTTEIKKCINCMNANKFLTKKRDIEHSADDINKCESFKIKWEQCISESDYPRKPDAPFD